jgi:hypothetical protein
VVCGTCLTFPANLTGLQRVTRTDESERVFADESAFYYLALFFLCAPPVGGVPVLPFLGWVSVRASHGTSPRKEKSKWFHW